MSCAATCIYRQETFSIEFIRTFARKTADYVVVAAGINGLLCYFFKIGEIKMASLQGAVTALVVNSAHHLSHQLPGDESEDLRKVLVTAGMFWGSIFFFPDIAVWCGKEVTFYDSLKFGAVSWVSIAIRNRFCH